jgi:hypothetical protein
MHQGQYRYRVTMKIEADGTPEDDPEITKEVTALGEREALDQARELVRTEHPELNYMKIWCWTIERRYY